MKYSVNTPLLV